MTKPADDSVHDRRLVVIVGGSSHIGSLLGGLSASFFALILCPHAFRVGEQIAASLGIVLGSCVVGFGSILVPRLLFEKLSPLRPTFLWFIACWIVSILAGHLLLERMNWRFYPWVLIAAPLGVWQGAMCCIFATVRSPTDDGELPATAVIGAIVAIVGQALGKLGPAIGVMGFVGGALGGVMVGSSIASVGWEMNRKVFGSPYYVIICIVIAGAGGGIAGSWRVWRNNKFPLQSAAEPSDGGD